MKEPELIEVAGGWEGRFRCGDARKRATLRTRNKHDATSRARRIREVLRAIAKSKATKRNERALLFLEEAAKAPSAAEFTAVCRCASDDAAKPEGASGGPLTFNDVMELWLTGVLRQRYPGAFKKQSENTASNTRKTLAKHVMPHVHGLAIRNFTLGHFQTIMAALPERITARNKIARSVDVILRGAVELGIIMHNPIKRSAIPPARDPFAIAFTYLYPNEEERLIRCAAVPLVRRAYYAFMVRNGTRPTEARLLMWEDLDLVNGTCNLDHTKSDCPRFWMMDPDVIAMLLRLKPEDAQPKDLVFPDMPSATNLAPQFRRDLKTAGCDRTALGLGKTNPFVGKPRRPIRCHDLRATFVTVALASGWTEAQVKERTGHESDIMLARYKRRATNAVELGHGNWFCRLVESLWPDTRPEDSPGVGQRLGHIIPIRRKLAQSASSSTTLPPLQVHAPAHKPGGKSAGASTCAQDGPAPKGGVGHPPNDLTAAIAHAAAAGKWDLAERLTAQLEGLLAAGGAAQ